MRFLFLLVLWFALGSSLGFAEKLAVLEFYGVGVDKAYLELLTDSARSGALEVGRGEGIEIYTRENMLMMLSDMGKSAECMEGSCEVEVARNISADYVVSGKVTKRGSTLILQMKFHETRGGTLLATEELKDTDELGLQQSVKPKTEGMIRKGLGLSGSAEVVTAEVEGLSGDLATRLAQLERQRADIAAAEREREAELERQRLERARLERELEKAVAEAKRPYQEKAKSEWGQVKRFAAGGDELGKQALELFVSEYKDVRVRVGNQEIKVDIPEVAEAQELIRHYRIGGQSTSSGNHEGFETVVVPGGTFMMGCLPSDGDCSSEEKPRHQVTISHAMEVMTTEVTQGLYESVMGKNPSKFSSCGKNCPVEQVSWYDAVAFANALSRKEGLSECYRINGMDVRWSDVNCSGWRLPTEAEWEYLARGGGEHLYSGSNSIEEVAWYRDNSGLKTHPVGQKQANGFGLYDMSGNVWEWCWDGSKRDYSSGSVTDPRGPSSGSYRVLRGGSLDYDAGDSRASLRGSNIAFLRYDDLGFRLLRKKI